MSYQSAGLADFTIAGDPTIHAGCDPIDTACVDRLLAAQAAGMTPQPGDAEYAAGQAARDAFNAALPQTINPYSAVVWSQKDAAGVTHHYGANGVELFATYPDGRAVATGAPISAALAAAINGTAPIAAPTVGPQITTAAGSGSNYVAAASGALSHEVGGVPLWGIAAAAGLGLLFFFNRGSR